VKALVTGATGFIGSHLARRLVARGYHVRALARPTSRRQVLSGLALEWAIGDVRDPGSLHKAIRGCDVLFHVAADYRLWVPDPAAMYASNVEGTRNVLAAARDAAVQRVVYTSSVATVGLPPDGRPGTEEDFVRPDDVVGHYKRSKVLAEREAFKACQDGLPVVIVNPSTPVGPGDVKPTPTGRIIRDFLRRRMVAYVDTGLNLIDVRDVAEGHVLALERGKVGQRYILGSRNLTLQQVFSILEKLTGIEAPRFRAPLPLAMALAYLDESIEGSLLGRTPWVPVVGVKLARKPMYFDAAKAVRELGLSPSPVEDALAGAAAWFTKHDMI
jgi:dihydroflavonol-4-reductase